VANINPDDVDTVVWVCKVDTAEQAQQTLP
jgi:hypothetical protein